MFISYIRVGFFPALNTSWILKLVLIMCFFSINTYTKIGMIHRKISMASLQGMHIYETTFTFFILIFKDQIKCHPLWSPQDEYFSLFVLKMHCLCQYFSP